MKNFEDIQSNWQDQAEIKGTEEVLEQIIKKTTLVKSKQKILNIILGITVAILIVFFFYIKAHLVIKATIGISLMIIALIVRIIIELLSINNLNKINYDIDFISFKQRLRKYYKARIRTHYIITPITLALYIIGFLILMPLFKENLSSGFYTYIKVSGTAIAVIGVYLIFKQIRKELLILKAFV